MFNKEYFEATRIDADWNNLTEDGVSEVRHTGFPDELTVPTGNERPEELDRFALPEWTALPCVAGPGMKDLTPAFADITYDPTTKTVTGSFTYWDSPNPTPANVDVTQHASWMISLVLLTKDELAHILPLLNNAEEAFLQVPIPESPYVLFGIGAQD